MSSVTTVMARHDWAAIALALVGIVTSTARPASAASFSVWVRPATARVFPDDPVLPLGPAAFAAARNESEGFQVVVHGGDTGLSGVDASIGELRDAAGHGIGADRVRLYREDFVTVTLPSFLGGVLLNPRAVGEYPDPLIPFQDPYDPAHPPLGAPFDVPAGRAQPIWVTVDVPEDTPSAVYEGTLTVTAAGRDAVAVPVQLTVWDFAIPRERTIQTAYGLSWNAVLDFHGGPDGTWDADGLAALQNYDEELHRHRVDQTDPAQRVPTPFQFDGAGELLPVDWSQFDAVMGPRLDGSYYQDGVGIAGFNVGFFDPGTSGGLQSSLTDAQYSAAAAALAHHLKEKGWFDKAYVYTKDEPWMDNDAYPRIVADVALMKAGDPDWAGHFLSTSYFDSRLEGSIDLWVPNTTVYDEFFVGWIGIQFPGRAVYDARRALGEKLWFYVCNCTFPPYAGYDIDTTYNYEPRILMWASWFEHASGFLYWRTNRWVTEDPWHQLIDPEAFPLVARNGDGFLFYPGDHDGREAPAGSPPSIAIDGPIGTVRLEATRDGLEDWEMFKLASAVAGEDAVRAIVAEAYKQPGAFFIPPSYNPFDPPWTLQEAEVRSVRERVAALIAPPPTGGCAIASGRAARSASDAACVLTTLAALAVARRRTSRRLR